MISYKNLFVFIFLPIVANNALCDSLKNDNNDTLVNIDFRIKEKSNEYIVIFKHYYWSRTREKYIRAALSSENISDFKVVLRPKLSYLYPSDFDVVKSTKNVVQKLSSHPAIKHVSSQSHIKRILSYTTVANVSRLYSKSNTKFVKQNLLLKNVPMELSYTLNADILWDRGITGAGIKVAVFDTGLAKKHPHFRNIKERTNWTNEKTLDDGVSHGTFVSGIIASSKECLGIAPDVELHIFRVFTNNQFSAFSSLKSNAKRLPMRPFLPW